MTNKDLLNINNHLVTNEVEVLQNQINKLESQLAAIEQKVESFELLLRSHLVEELILVQELTVLYKQQKKLKKEKRLAQKKRGKNYIEPVGLKITKPLKQKTDSKENSKERKRLYREAMLKVHPDKFTMDDRQSELATEITTKLIEIYQTGSLSKLRLYHAHLFSGGTAILAKIPSQVVDYPTLDNAYLKQEIVILNNKIKAIKESHLYQVLSTYKNPKSFIYELKAYYKDKITKLKRRTRS